MLSMDTHKMSSWIEGHSSLITCSWKGVALAGRANSTATSSATRGKADTDTERVRSTVRQDRLHVKICCVTKIGGIKLHQKEA